MRLIDDEKVVHEYYKNPSYHQLCKVLNEAEEVIAIPIEWLYQKRTLYLENGCYMSLMVINELLNWWEKEHEKDI